MGGGGAVLMILLQYKFCIHSDRTLCAISFEIRV